jgi:hypothetical protein
MLTRRAVAPAIIALALTLAAASSAKANLYPNGIIASNDITLTDLESTGWTEVFSENSDTGPITEATISGWIADADGGDVLLAGANSDGVVVLGASGLASDVLQQTFSTGTADLYSSSNLYWYNVAEVSQGIGSIGFADSSSVDLNQADEDDPSDLYRLSWHIDFNGGGYRLGDIEALNDGGGGNGYTFDVLVSGGGPAPAPDATATLGLAVIGFAGIFGFRRKAAALKA